MWLRESERSTVRFQSQPFERGWILDRSGQPLAKTEEVRDLTFRFRSWRRNTVAGLASHAWKAMGASRAPIAEAISRAEELTYALGEVRVDSISELPSRLQRRDLGFYIEKLFGKTTWNAVVAGLRADNPPDTPLSELPGYEEGLARSLERAGRERAALADLAWAAGLQPEELLDGMEHAASRAEQRVSNVIERELERELEGEVAVPDDERDLYKRRQQLHAEFDDDPTRLVQRVSYDTRTLIAIRAAELGGFDIATEIRRIYPEALQDVAPLLIGRIGEPQPEDIDQALERRLRLSDLSSLTTLSPEELDELERLRIQVREVDYKYGEERGMFGLEAAFEELLRGKRGWVARSETIEHDSVEQEEPRRGLNVMLTLDSQLQLAAQEVLDEVFDRAPEVVGDDGQPLQDVPPHWSGAIVLLDPQTGRILAMATGPRPTRDELEQRYGWLMSSDPWVRLRHRAVDPGKSGNLPPPGSTFKPVSALAGLTFPGAGITRHTVFECLGQLAVGDRTMGCLGNHGEIALEEAIARSCNIYFYRLGRAVGIEALREMAMRFGFGRGEKSGLLLDNEVLESVGIPIASGVHESAPSLGPGDSTTDAMRLAIGQAPLDDVTPLQVATMMAAVGTGTFRPPSLVLEVEGYPPLPSRAGTSLGIPNQALDAVRDGMARVMDGVSGTGRRLNAALVEKAPWLVGTIAAKTGTAQVGPGGKDQAWFAGFLPRDNPRLAFAVLIEDCGLHGSEAAAPVFGKLLEKPAMERFLRDEILRLPKAVR